MQRDALSLAAFSEQILGCSSADAVLQRLAEAVRMRSAADGVVVVVAGESVGRAGDERAALAIVAGPSLTIGGADVASGISIADVERVHYDERIREELTAAGLRSYVLVSARSRAAEPQCWVELHYTSRFHSLRVDERLFIEAALALGDQRLRHLRERALRSDGDASNQGPYRRLVDQGDIVVVRIDGQFNVSTVIGDIQRLVGVGPDTIISRAPMWRRLFHPRDVQHLRQRLLAIARHGGEINEEFRIIHQSSRERRWILVRAVALRDANQQFLGWEGFGLDVTARREDHENAMQQSRRLEALYTVARSLATVRDPAYVTLDGLRALLTATNSEGGLGVLYDEATRRLELVAARGVSENYVSQVQHALSNQPTLVRLVVEQRRGELIPNIQLDPRANRALAAAEGVKATIIMPLIHEGRVRGVIVLFCRRARRYTQADFELVDAASQQMSSAIAESERGDEERKQAASFAALYRLSHELSRFTTSRDICEHAAPIIAHELQAKRVWIGIMNEKRTHILGQAGAGPGMRRRLIEVQLELDLVHQFLDEAIRTHNVVIREAGQAMDCSLMNRLLEPLELGTVVFAPLLSLGQSVGVLAIEPELPSQFVSQRRLPLVTAMASELAAVIVARRLETKIADTHRMKMAGLLAAGVAHNFNNLLQAVIGQASLIEMQVPRGSALQQSAKTIVEAGHKGAGLIKQLLTFSRHEAVSRSEVDINKLLGESADFYRSVLGPGVNLSVIPFNEALVVGADYGQLQQIVTNILINAKEAVGGAVGSQVVIKVRRVRVRTGEVDPELPPGLYCAVDIEDNGPGMNEELRRRCFEPFFTTKNVDGASGIGVGSAGLGLSTAYSLARQHDGVVVVTSEEGRGSTFSIYLPLRSNEAQLADRSADEVQAPVKVLAVEAEEEAPVAAVG